MPAASPEQPDFARLWGTLSAAQRDLLVHAAACAEAEGGAAYLVGGPVRDLLRGVALLHDIDLVTTTDARNVAHRFATERGATVAKTTDFGTATVRLPDDNGGTSVDFATARTETYPRPGALPVVAFPATIGEDLHRRDLTINAMALPITPHGFGALLDPTGGLADLRSGIIRVLHDASFRDDPTRLYRTTRYAVRFGFVVEPHTASLIHATVADGALMTISPDRKRHELDLGIREPDPVACFAAFDAFGVLRATSPVLIWDEWIATRVPLVAPTAWPVYAFFVCRQDDAAVKRLLTDLPMRAMHTPIRLLVRIWQERERIANASHLSMLRPLLPKLPEREVLALFVGEPAGDRAAAFYARIRYMAHQDLWWGVSFGNYLKDLGVPSGPIFREVLDGLRDARLDGVVETREDAEIYLRSSLDEQHSTS